MKHRKVPGWVMRVMRQAYTAHKGGNLGMAAQLYERVLNKFPEHPIALHYAALLGRTLNDHAKQQGKPTNDDAVMRLMAASIAAAPDNAAAVHNFAKFKHDRGEVEDARQLYEIAVARRPDQGESWTNLGNIYGELGNRLRAEACWARAMESPFTTPDAKHNLSFLRLLKGDYLTGFQHYEARLDCPEFWYNYGRPDLSPRRWKGEPLGGPLLLHMEQGAGDAFMFARYVALARERTQPVTVEVIRGLAPLFRATFPDLEVAVRGDGIAPHVAQASLMSLPAILGATLSNVPPPTPFGGETVPLRPESGRIGLCWRGSTTHTNDRIRSMPFEATFPLLDLPGLTWQSLQWGYETSAPLDSCPAGDFLDTAREIARCSLVITVDTSVAHLAASMGVLTWILLPISAEWRWLQDRTDSPWYPSAVLWRCDRPGDWPGLVDRVRSALTETLNLKAA